MRQLVVLMMVGAGLMAAPRAAVTLAFDQGWTAASSSGVPGVVYVSTGWVGKPGFLGWAQLQGLQAKGWEIGCSTVNHNLATELSPSELEYELEQGKVDLQKHGMTAVSFASSFGDYNPRTVEAIQKKFGSHIAGEHPKPSASTRKQDAGDAERFAKMAPLAATMNTVPYDRYLLAVRAVTAKTTAADVAAWIEEAKTANAWLILLVTDAKAPVAAVSATVKASGLPVVTVKDELARAGQTSKAKVTWADPPYKPLSEWVPKPLAELPSFGAVDWKLERLPFVTPGPQGGVSGMAYAVLNNEIYMAGGYIPGGDETADRASRETSRWAWKYAPARDEWTKLPDMPARREYPTGLAAEGSFYVLGGGEQKRGLPAHWTVSKDCFRWDGAKWRACPALNVRRSHMAAGTVGHFLVTVGGAEYDWNATDPYQRRGNTEVLDLRNPSAGWQQKRPIPGEPRAWSASAVCAGKLWVIGGIKSEPDAAALTDTLSYDPEKDEWTRGTPLPVGGHSWGAACYQDRFVMVVGGLTGYGESQVWSDLVFAYDTTDRRWMKVEHAIPGGAVMSDVGVAIVGDTLYAAGAEGPKGTHFDLLRVGRIRRGQ